MAARNALAVSPLHVVAEYLCALATPRRTRNRLFDADSIGQSSFLTFIRLWTPLTPSVSRAMATALSAAS
jgi:hypothetical protein